MKSEPETRIEKGVDVKFGIEDLKSEPDQTACWDGVRNYQARNFMRDLMKVGDKSFFYHRYKKQRISNLKTDCRMHFSPNSFFWHSQHLNPIYYFALMTARRIENIFVYFSLAFQLPLNSFITLYILYIMHLNCYS